VSTDSSLLRAARANPPSPQKVLFVGEANPYGGDPEFALWPSPPGCAGDRLCRLVLGLDPDDYLERFDRTNLCPVAWNAAVAGRRVRELQAERAGGTLVLLGSKVTSAFGIPFEPFFRTVRFVDLKPTAFVVLPHPSGLSRSWNAPGAYERARSLLVASGVLS
jgi:hypothetical protein